MTDSIASSTEAESAAHGPTIGICIPTYKRPNFLRRSVLSIIRSANGRRVEIFISDDSGDGTNFEVLAELRALYPYIHTRQNQINLGIDRNILASVSFCSADYAWLLGEDDVLVPEAIPLMEEAMRNNPGLPLYCCNYSYVSNEYEFFFKERVIALAEDTRVTAKDFFERYSWAIGFIGACAINRRLWNPAEAYVGTFYAHVASIYKQIVGAEVYMLATPLVLNRAENARSFTWSSSALDVFLGWEVMLKALAADEGGFAPERAIEQSAHLFRPRSLLWLISKRADGVFDLESYRTKLVPRLSTLPQRLGGWCVAVMPRSICQLIKLLGKELPRRVLRTAIPTTKRPL